MTTRSNMRYNSDLNRQHNDNNNTVESRYSSHTLEINKSDWISG